MAYSKTNRRIALASAVIAGAGFVLFQTYPHLVSRFWSKKTLSPEEEEIMLEIENKKAQQELEKQKYTSPSKQVEEWNEQELRSFLKQVSLFCFFSQLTNYEERSFSFSRYCCV